MSFMTNMLFFFVCFFLTPIHCHESGCRVVLANQSQPLSHQKTNWWLSGRVEKWDAFNFSSLCDVWFPYCCGVVCCNLQVLIASCELIFVVLCWHAITRFLCAAAVAADFADWVFLCFLLSFTFPKGCTWKDGKVRHLFGKVFIVHNASL